MAKIKDVTAYICAMYPHKHELSKTRVTKLVYLSDWKSAQKNEKQLTKIKWYFHNFGPYVDAVIDSAKKDSRFEIISTLNLYGDAKVLFSIRDGENYKHGLSDSEMALIDEVILETNKLYWDSFIKHVYETFPIRVTNRHKNLNLIALAKQEVSINNLKLES
jgi:hypothetical protein